MLTGAELAVRVHEVLAEASGPLAVDEIGRRAHLTPTGTRSGLRALVADGRAVTRDGRWAVPGPTDRVRPPADRPA